VDSLTLLLPAIAFALALLVVAHSFNEDDGRAVVLHTTVIFGAALVLLVETLSLVRGVTQAALAVAAGAACVTLGAWARSQRGVRATLVRIRPRLPEGWADRILLAIILAFVVLTGVVALLSPPQTWDSLTYHASRVAHWALNQSVAHYPSGIPRQNSMSPGAEVLILVTYLMAQSDRFMTAPQWLAMVGSLVVVSLMASHLGRRRSTPWLAGVVLVTIPIGIVESSSTITDYVVALWVLAAYAEAFLFAETGHRRNAYLCAAAAGLALLTKPTAVPYLAALSLFVVVWLWRRLGLRRAVGTGLLGLGIVGLLNAGYLGRNLATYGSLSNPVDFRNHFNASPRLAVHFSGVLKHAALEAGLPEWSGGYNQWLYEVIQKVHVKIGVRLKDPMTTGDGVFGVRVPTAHEDVATSPYHAYLAVVSAIGLVLLRRSRAPSALVYAGLVATGFLLFAAFFKWHVFGGRYHLTFFVLIAPVMGVVLSGLGRAGLGHGLAVLLSAASLPWLLSIPTRPLVPNDQSRFRVSLVALPREDLLLVNTGDLAPFIREAAGDIREARCRDVSIYLGGDDAEYPWWALLGAPASGVRVDWIVSDVTSRYARDPVEPCAIVCHLCLEGWSRVAEWELRRSFDGWKLFLPRQEEVGA